MLRPCAPRRVCSAQARRNGRDAEMGGQRAATHRAHCPQVASRVQELDAALGGKGGQAAAVGVVLDVPHLALQPWSAQRHSDRQASPSLDW